MPKKNSHLKKIAKIHKIIIYPNRWLIWTLVLSGLICISLFSYINIISHRTDAEMMEYAPVIRRAITYTDYGLGFTLKHPVAWSAEAEAGNTISFLDPQNFGEGISVSVMESIKGKSFQASLNPFMEKTISLDGEQASYMTVGPRTAPEKIVSVNHSGRLYVIRGSGIMFDKILPSFRFTGGWLETLPGSQLKFQPESE